LKVWDWALHYLTLAAGTWWGPKVLLSVLVLALAPLLARLARGRIRRLALDGDDRLRWQVTARNLVFGGMLLCLVLVWAEQIQSVMLSVVAIAAALVLAGKEVLLCLSGSAYRTFSGAFKIGDRIEVAGWRGDVIDHGPLATTLLEIGPGRDVHQVSGRLVVLPNALFLSHPVVNESFTDEFVLHLFEVAVPLAEWRKAQRLLLEAANEVCFPWLDEARQWLGNRLDRWSVVPVGLEPRVSLHVTGGDQVRLLVRVPVPSRRKGRVEQEILHRYLDEAFPPAPPPTNS
jgi:small-conductance mechanosensitive channel